MATRFFRGSYRVDLPADPFGGATGHLAHAEREYRRKYPLRALWHDARWYFDRRYGRFWRHVEMAAVALLVYVLATAFWLACAGATGVGSPPQNPTITRVPLTTDRAR